LLSLRYSGHLADKCFQLIGYPPGWKGPRGKIFVATPYISKHFQRISTANNIVVLEQNSGTPNIVFSQEQIQNLLSLTNSISNSNLNSTAKDASASSISFSCHTISSSQNQFTWILDTGATNHMICTLFFYSIVLPRIQSKVHLSNGQTVPIVFTGIVKFSPDIILHNALYVPSFNVNLVFVSRLIADSTVGFFFLQTKCILQNLSKWRMIGLVAVESGLYFLRVPLDQSNNKCLPPSSLVKSCIVASDLWLFCLGHIPASKINLLSKFDSSVTATSNSICEICPLTKQKKATFSSVKK